MLSLAVTAVLGEWLCLQREMQDIPIFGRKAGSDTEMVSLRTSSGPGELPSPTAVHSTSFSFIKTPGSVSATRALSTMKASGPSL